MNHCIESILSKESIDELAVSDVCFDQAEVVGPFKGRQVGSFASRIVEIIEVVQDGDLVVSIPELARQVATDETGTTGHKNV